MDIVSKYPEDKSSRIRHQHQIDNFPSLVSESAEEGIDELGIWAKDSSSGRLSNNGSDRCRS